MPAKFDFSKYLTANFVETGTYHGNGCINAIRSGFKNVYSIEILEENHKIGTNNVNKYINDNNITVNTEFLVGDSIDMLPVVLDKIDGRCTFWLDGHDVGAGVKGCPLYEELDAISRHKIKNHIILIDDLRIIRNHAWQTRDINIETIINKILKINPDYKFTFDQGIIKDDVLVAVV
tara:strand:- start:334 stop:864 length:531 start_codon:yes stop_codon:yes gene_type:complete